MEKFNDIVTDNIIFYTKSGVTHRKVGATTNNTAVLESFALKEIKKNRGAEQNQINSIYFEQ